MIENIEHTIIKYLQNLPCRDFITTLMRLVSIPFNLVPFFLIILVLYYYRKISSCQVLIIIMSQLTISFIKFLVKRERPFVQDSDIMMLDNMKFDEYSFPSGHVLNVFLLSGILKTNFGMGLGIIPYMVAISRMYLGVHHLSDLVGGYALAKIMLYLSSESSHWLSKN